MGSTRAEQGIEASSDVHDHLLTFYERDDSLIASVVDLLGPARSSGHPTVVIATRQHLAAIEDALPEDAGSTSVALEAKETVERLMVDGELDAEAVERVIGGILDDLTGGGGTPHVFGEMVAVLWERGEAGAAIELEDLWNRLARTRKFVLLCGYPVIAFEEEDEEHAGALRTVREKHSSVIPSDSHPRLLSADDGHVAEFVAMVVHDIRTPALIASGYLDLLRDSWDELEPEEVRELLGVATENLDRIQRLVDDVLTVSRIDRGEFSVAVRPVDLARVVERTVRQMRERHGPDIVFESPSDARALADEDRQVQIVANLLSNAIKFSRDDGTVRVTIEAGDEHLVVSVADDGIGIPADERQLLFRPFSRLDDEQRSPDHGTGLGLYITKALVEAQGGRIWVDSEPGEGSTFSYTVPAASSER